MSSLMTELFYGRPEPVRLVRSNSFATEGHYFSDGDDYYPDHHHRSSHRSSAYNPYVSSHGPMLPDVQLSVPLDSMRCVEKVKDALTINGVRSVVCDIPSQTVTVSGNVAPQALLKRVRHVKRKAKILSYSSPYDIGSSAYPSSYGGYERSQYSRSAPVRSQAHMSPPRSHSYYSRNHHSAYVPSQEYYGPSYHPHYSHY